MNSWTTWMRWVKCYPPPKTHWWHGGAEQQIDALAAENKRLSQENEFLKRDFHNAKRLAESLADQLADFGPMQEKIKSLQERVDDLTPKSHCLAEIMESVENYYLMSKPPEERDGP